MAAVLCQGVSKMCSALGTSVRTIACLPCKACGVTCDFVTDIFRNDFCFYVSVTMGLNIPPIVFTLMVFLGNLNGDGGCNNDSGKSNWLLLNGILCIIHISASIYISNSITKANKPFQVSSINDQNGSLENNKDVEGGDVVSDEYSKTNMDGTVTAQVYQHKDTPSEGSLARVKQVLCYDPIVAIYILLLIFFFIWQTRGLSNLMSGQDGNGNEECRKKMADSITFGFFFLAIGGIALFFSLFCVTSKKNFRMR